MRLVLFVAGCVSFQAVTITAQLGDRVGRYQRALDPVGALCRFSAATGTQPLDACRALDDDARRLRRIPQELAAWATALRSMAEDKDSRDLGGDVGALAALAWPNESARVGAAVEALTKLVTHSYRRRVLAESVKRAAPHVATLVEFARGAVKLQLERVDTLAEQAGRIAATLPTATPADVAQRIALADVEVWLAGTRDNLRDYDCALSAFGAAHARLAKSTAKLDDPDLYLAILSDLEGVAQAVAK